MNISFVLGSYNRKKFLKLTIECIRKEKIEYNLDGEIIVIDGGSSDGTLKWLNNQKDIITIVQHNHGNWNGKPVARQSWGYFMNLAFKMASNDYICMLSDDCLIVPGSVKNAIELLDDKRKADQLIGGAAFYWRDFPGPDRYWVGSLFESTFLINHGIFYKPALQSVGFIDELSYRFYYADSDLCLRMHSAGYKIILSENSFIEHYSHANMKVRRKNSVSTNSDMERFINKWGNTKFDVNPYYDKNKTVIEHHDNLETYRMFKKAILIDYHYMYLRMKEYIKSFGRKK